jgi:hypothetical protein
VIHAQDNQYSKTETVSFQSKPLRFGNNFSPVSSIKISENFPEEYKEPLFVKDYRLDYLTYDPVRDPRRLAYNSSIYVGSTIIAFGVLWLMPESVTGWDKESMKDGGFWKRWRDNVKNGPVWDHDGFLLNWIMHPYMGGIYYMTARGSGFKRWESFTYSVIMSTFFWEYGVEAFAEKPSWQDLIITPTLGSVIGETFFVLKRKIVQNEKKVLKSRLLGGTVLFLMDPFNQILDGVGYKTKNKIQVYSSVAPIDLNPLTGRSVWGLQVSMQF